MRHDFGEFLLEPFGAHRFDDLLDGCKIKRPAALVGQPRKIQNKLLPLILGNLPSEFLGDLFRIEPHLAISDGMFVYGFLVEMRRHSRRSRS